MKFAIISGSHRKNSESFRISQYLEKTVKSLFKKAEVYLFSLAENPLPLWDEGVWEKADRWKKVWGPISKELLAADAIIVVSPEWSGMVPAGLKNFFLLCSNDEIKHKAGLIVAVSSSFGGSYPVAELRMSSYKNTGICYMPEHIIVRHCKTMLQGDKPANEDDKYIRGRIEYAIKMLEKYAIAINTVRESGVIDNKTYPNGM